MDLKVSKNAYEFITTLLDRKKELDNKVHFIAQKRAVGTDQSNNPFVRTTPAKAKISSKNIYDYVNKLIDDKTTCIHTLMIIKDGNLVFDLEKFPYRTDRVNYTFSMCKSLTGLAIGMLIDEQKLKIDDHITDIFAEEMTAIYKIRFKDITIKHLLTMSTGATFNELGSIAVNDWLKAYLSTNLKFKEGTEFEYNSMNSYVLSAIVTKLTGHNMSEYLKTRLFESMQITDVTWEKCPMGIDKGGWGLYLSPLAMAKIGMLYLNKGRYQDKQLISEAWIRQATSFKMKVPVGYGSFDYGYHVWCKRDSDIFLLNGMFGQNVLISPSDNLLIITTAGNSDNFQTNAFFDITFDFINKINDHVPSRDDTRYDLMLDKLKQRCELYPNIAETQTSPKFSFTRFINRFLIKDKPDDLSWLNGRRYDVDMDQNRRTSVLPLFLRGILNNHTEGLAGVTFALEEELIKLTFNEGKQTVVLDVESNKPTYQTINYNGDTYECVVTSELLNDEDHNKVIKLTIYFTEYFATRFIKLRFISDDKLKIEFDEDPGLTYISKAINKLDQHSKEFQLLQLLDNKLDLDLVRFRLVDILNPIAYGTLKREENN